MDGGQKKFEVVHIGNEVIAIYYVPQQLEIGRFLVVNDIHKELAYANAVIKAFRQMTGM